MDVEVVRQLIALVTVFLLQSNGGNKEEAHKPVQNSQVMTLTSKLNSTVVTQSTETQEGTPLTYRL